jgi:hypothetical protein
VQAASETYAGTVSFYGVVSGADQSVSDIRLRGVIQDLGLTYPQIRDRDGSWSRRFRVSSTPTIVVFSPDGTQRFRGNHLPPDWGSLLGG